MRQSVLVATLLSAFAWAAPAPALDWNTELSRRGATEGDAYTECYQQCVRGCFGPISICQPPCIVACFAAAGEADANVALETREIAGPVQHGSLVTRSNYVECHQNCVRGCPGAWICQATCNVACANAGESEHETAALTAREAVVAATKSLALRDEGHSALAARSNYVECHQNCVRGCPGAWICQAACNVACANAGEGDETFIVAARENAKTPALTARETEAQ